MKKLFIILVVLILGYNLISAQENLFEKANSNTFTKSIKEKVERYKTRGALKQSGEVRLKPNTVVSKNFKGIFNIFDKNLEFEITNDFGKDVNGVQGYKAELKEGGYAIISSSNEGIVASIWNKENFYSIEAIEDGIYFVSEIDIKEIAKHENPNDYGSIKKLNKTNHNTSVASALSAATIKVFVAYTPAVAQNYNVSTLINQCISTTNTAYQYSLVSSTIELAGSAQLTYTESGDDSTDVTRFMTKNDGYLDEIHSLRNQYDADVCVLLVNSLNSNGRVPDYAIGAVRSNAFFVVLAGSAASYYSFPHELGHLLGCRHEEDNSSSEPYANAHGYYWNGKLPYSSSHYYPYKTIMCIDEKYYRVQFFSNPYVYDEDNNPMGSTNYYYSAFAVDDYASIIDGFAPYCTSSGTLEENEWWRGTVTITGNVTIPSNITLTIEAGTQIYYNQGASLMVNGTLNAVGNSNNRITFTRSGSSGTWGGIQFNTGSSGNINYANISNASYGIYASQTNSITISNTEISNCSSHGIYLYNNYNYQPTISNCIIHDNTSTGIVMYYTSPFITGCNIYNNYNGLGIADLSDPQLGDYNVPGNNNIHNNSNIGVYTLRYSSPMLGINSSPTQGGNNIVASNSFREAQAETYCYLFAENNWWGSNPPNSSKIAALSGSVIDYDPWLVSQPSFSLMPPGTLAEWKNTEISLQTSVNEFDIQPVTNLVKSEQAESDEETAYSIYQLKQLWHQAKGSDINTFKNYLRGLSEKKEKKHLSAVAKLILSNYEKKKKINILDEIITEYEEQMIVETALMNKFLFYFNEIKDYKEASNVMDYIGLKFPDSQVYTEAKDHFRILNLSSGLEKEETKITLLYENKIATNDEIYLGDNYPNPFNPTTTIRYKIANDGLISLRVYNLLGQEIAVLVNEYQKAGEHTVNFDGSGLSSGVYIYKLIGNNLKISKKMILMK